MVFINTYKKYYDTHKESLNKINYKEMSKHACAAIDLDPYLLSPHGLWPPRGRSQVEHFSGIPGSPL